MKLLFVLGTRPQFIKASALVSKLNAASGIELSVLHTQQHYDKALSEVFLQEFKFPSDTRFLDISKETPAQQTATMLKGVSDAICETNPAQVITIGDCNTTLAASIAAFKNGVPSTHIEAGPRDFDMRLQEEMNRVVADHSAQMLFAPTPSAVKNLKDEAVKGKVFLTGDLSVDVLEASLEDVKKMPKPPFDDYYLATFHRAENVDDKNRLSAILETLSELDGTVVFPIHPRTKKRVGEFGLAGKVSKNVKLVEPMGYRDFLNALLHSRLLLTDSGGLQKETYLLGLPCVTFNDTTGWLETVGDCGNNRLVGQDKQKALAAVRELEGKKFSLDKRVFGENVSQKMLDIILNETPEFYFKKTVA